MKTKSAFALLAAFALPMAANANDSTAAPQGRDSARAARHTMHDSTRAAHHEMMSGNRAEHDSMKAAHKEQRQELRTQIKDVKDDSAKKAGLRSEMKELKASQKADNKAVREQNKEERKAAKGCEKGPAREPQGRQEREVAANSARRRGRDIADRTTALPRKARGEPLSFSVLGSGRARAPEESDSRECPSGRPGTSPRPSHPRPDGRPRR